MCLAQKMDVFHFLVMAQLDYYQARFVRQAWVKLGFQILKLECWSTHGCKARRGRTLIQSSPALFHISLISVSIPRQVLCTLMGMWL